jgi:hypothetical protein
MFGLDEAQKYDQIIRFTNPNKLLVSDLQWG